MIYTTYNAYVYCVYNLKAYLLGNFDKSHSYIILYAEIKLRFTVGYVCEGREQKE